MGTTIVCRRCARLAGAREISRLTVGHQEAFSLLVLMRLLHAKCVPGSTETRTGDPSL
jgi:hypothetical protein